MKTTFKFKHRELSRTKVRNNILRVWDKTTSDDRYDWYQEAHEVAVEMAAGTGDTSQENISKCCGVLAALSPMREWEQNKKVAQETVETGIPSGHTKLFLGKAARIMSSDGSVEEVKNILNGEKIKSFYMNILFPDREKDVTIDRHALSIAIGEPLTDEERSGVTLGQYDFIARCFEMAAKRAGVSVLKMQSATWLAYRRMKKQK